jgi:hypothetical protein
MKDFTITKTLGVVVGLLTIFGAIGFGLFAIIGTSLSKALNSGQDTSSTQYSALLIFGIIFLFGLITAIGSFVLKSKGGHLFYIGFCFILGVCFIVTFFISFGAIGNKYELFILFVGLVYLLLSYLAVKKK